MPLTRDTVLDLLRRSRQELCRNNNVIAFREITQCATDILLAGAALVSDSGVVKIHAQLQTALDDLSCMLLVYRPAVLTSLRIAEAHAAHADTGYIQIRIT